MTSAAVSVTELPLKVLPSSLSVMVSYFGSPEMVTVTLSPTWGTLTPRPRDTWPPGLTDSEWSATVRVGAFGVVVLPDPLLLPDEVPPVGSVTVVPPLLPVELEPVDEPVLLPVEPEPVEVEPVLLPVELEPVDEEPVLLPVEPEPVDEEPVLLPVELEPVDEPVLLPVEPEPVDVEPVLLPDEVDPPEVEPVLLPVVVPDEELPPTPVQLAACAPVTIVVLRKSAVTVSVGPAFR